MGLKFSIATDSHSTAGFANMRFGIDQARRGWLEAADVINTYSLEKLRKSFRR
jgi:DNA polymerase (family 10)